MVPGASQRARHVLGVPLWPVRIRPRKLLLVNSVRRRGAFERRQQGIRHLSIEELTCGPARKPFLDFLQQPGVAVRITEGGVREV